MQNSVTIEEKVSENWVEICLREYWSEEYASCWPVPLSLGFLYNPSKNHKPNKFLHFRNCYGLPLFTTSKFCAWFWQLFCNLLSCIQIGLVNNCLHEVKVIKCFRYSVRLQLSWTMNYTAELVIKGRKDRKSWLT
jgi:hypothetical protein